MAYEDILQMDMNYATFEDQAVNLFMAIHQTHATLWIAAERRLIKIGLTPEKVMVLAVCKNVSPAIPAEIARKTRRRAQTVVGLLNRIEREGLVKRIHKRKGRPFTEIMLTEKGEAALESSKPVLQDFVDKFRDIMNEQLKKGLTADQISSFLQSLAIASDAKYSHQETRVIDNAPVPF